MRKLEAYQEIGDDINSFERKILRRIFGPVNENGQWRCRYNKELYELYEDLDLVTFVNLKGYNGLDTFNDCPWTVSQRKPLEQRSPAGDQLESPGKYGRMR
jgi:hypothetical protein